MFSQGSSFPAFLTMVFGFCFNFVGLDRIVNAANGALANRSERLQIMRTNSLEYSSSNGSRGESEEPLGEEFLASDEEDNSAATS